MPTYIAIADAEVAAEAPITVSLMTRLRDNALAYLGAPSTTAMLFRQATAPLGWTKLTNNNDKALRVVSGALADGGVLAFSSAFGQQTTNNFILTQAHLPNVSLSTNIASGQGSHPHTVPAGAGSHVHVVAAGQGNHDHDINPDAAQVFGTTNTGAGASTASAGATRTGFATLPAMDVSANTLPQIDVPANTLPAMTGTTPLGGSGTPFAIGMDMRVQYLDVIIATKDA